MDCETKWVLTMCLSSSLCFQIENTSGEFMIRQFIMERVQLNDIFIYKNYKIRLRGPSTDQDFLGVRFPVGAGSSHTKDVKNGSGPCLHGTHDEVGTTKHNWSARCQYNM